MRRLRLLLLAGILVGTGLPASAADRPADVQSTDSRSTLFQIETGSQFRDCTDCPLMAVIPAGSYKMGSPPGERGRAPDEGPVHTVTFDRPFAIGVYEVTFANWRACINDGGCSHFPGDEGWGRGERPVVNVNISDMGEYVRWLRDETGLDYRLPSEAEWEYAARAGTTTPRYWRSRQAPCAFANTYDVSGKRTHGLDWQGFTCIDAYGSTAPVGRFLPNDFGLYDTLGNVWEMVADCWHNSYAGAPTDGSVWQGGDCRRYILRGGSWKNVSWATRSAFRGWQGADTRVSHVGFRVARFSR